MAMGLDHAGGSSDAAGTPHWRLLHEVLYPIGRRQRDVLAVLAPDAASRDALAALHAGVRDGLLARLARRDAADDVCEWILLSDTPRAADYVRSLTGTPHVRAATAEAMSDAWEQVRLPGDAYSAVLPGDLRHRLGEHYTPAPLVDRILVEVRPTERVADPSCGDGRFIAALLRRGHDPARVWGCDINPLAVVMARYEAWHALGCPPHPPNIRICWSDFLISARNGSNGVPWPAYEIGEYFIPDHFIGNPPWILWRNLGESYRRALGEEFRHTPLHQARGWNARVSAGQTDISHLFIHEALERVGHRGRVSFVLPKSTFKGPIGASVVRSGATANGRRFRYVEVADYAESTIFGGVRGNAVIAFAEADAEQAYPVPWRSAAANGQTPVKTTWAWPNDADDIASAWYEGERDDRVILAYGVPRASLVARGGINTGGGNGVFHVDVLETLSDGTVVIRNRPSRGVPARTVRARVEGALVRPLLRGRDIELWRTRPEIGIVVPHGEADLRKPLERSDLSANAPLTLAYLANFEAELAGRNEVSRWGSSWWYQLFRIGHYTAGCWRVVWPSSAGQRMRAAVLSPSDRCVPDQKVVLVAFEAAEAAHFLCGLLNSRLLRSAIAQGSGLDASPSLVKRLPLPRWNPRSGALATIAAISAAAHQGDLGGLDVLDDLVGELYQRPGSPARDRIEE